MGALAVRDTSKFVWLQVPTTKVLQCVFHGVTVCTPVSEVGQGSNPRDAFQDAIGKHLPAHCFHCSRRSAGVWLRGVVAIAKAASFLSSIMPTEHRTDKEKAREQRERFDCSSLWLGFGRAAVAPYPFRLHQRCR